jgi:hypothetical protein
MNTTEEIQRFLTEYPNLTASVFSKFGINPKPVYTVEELKDAVQIFGGNFLSALTDVVYEVKRIEKSNFSNWSTDFEWDKGQFDVQEEEEFIEPFPLYKNTNNTEQINAQKEKKTIWDGLSSALGFVDKIFSTGKKGVDTFNDARRGDSVEGIQAQTNNTALQLEMERQRQKQQNLLLFVGIGFVILLILLITRKN